MDVAKLTIATFGGVIISWIGTVWELVFFAFIAILLDYITGVMAGRISEKGLNSQRAAKGLYKKMGFISLLCLGFLLDGAFNHFIAEGFSLPMPFPMPIGLIAAVWIVITEAISICENIEKLGVQIPSWIVLLLRKSKKTIDDEKEANVEAYAEKENSNR